MKLGIIIVCHNNEDQIDEHFYLSYVAKLEGVELCLVNNNSSDATFEILSALNEQCPNVSVVHIKKHKPQKAAIRAGARYMFNKFNLKHLGYVSNLNEIHMSRVIKTIYQNKGQIVGYNKQLQNTGNTKKTLIRALFSISECLEKLHVKLLSPIH